ncbi:MAG: ATP-dependent DNA helicase [Altererythrobacter sp.]|nr:ATP-dependent DNA helicase [Altererythrobacter sp.]
MQLRLPSLHASHAGTWLTDEDGATRAISKGEAVMAAADTPLLVLNAPLVASRLGYPELSGLDLLELFAFVHPARFCVPTPKGLAHALGLAEASGDGDVPRLLRDAAGALLAQCADSGWAERDGAWSALQSLIRMRWPWAQVLAAHVARPATAEKWLFARLPEWEEAGERPSPTQVLLDELEIEGRLERLTGEGAEQREGQRHYARHAGGVFAPRQSERRPHVLLAQAGTGIGKTLGYLAPASLWAERSGGTVWVSTYTKNLQRQLRQQSARAWPAARADGSQPVVVRKGRENYLCLLNLEDALQGGFSGRAAVLAQLVARWAAYSRDGDMIGGDLPGWLGTLFRKRAITALTDKRGECVYAACPHYRKCFIERAARASAQADLVIANHALVMVNAARSGFGGRDHAQRPTRIVFDEGHHVFDAADATFSAALTGGEAIELRRWLVGPERASRGRRRGLAARLADLASFDEAGGAAIAAALDAAQALPSDGWLPRLAEGMAQGPIEALLAQVRALTYARDESGGIEAGYGIETEAAQMPGELVDAAGHAEEALAAVRVPLIRLAGRLEATLQDPPDWLDAQGRARIEGARHSLAWRIDLLAAWEALLGRLGGPGDPEFVDWLAVDRGPAEGGAREYDVGLYRHWLDPMKPFARVVLEPAHGVMLTSATLTDRDESGPDWEGAVVRSGARHLELEPRTALADSPFDYARRAEVLIVTDIRKGDPAALAGAFARLIEASNGGALGLFTAIRRLRTVASRIADRLARAGLPLYAQHVDPIDTGTLTDIFRDDPHASLMGTDALRDGVDVPGRSLRLVILEAVPWPRPTILHRARRAAAAASAGEPGGAQRHDDRIVRARLAQAFGRLIRTREDAGHFVVLSPAFPTRLLSAFPPGTPVIRLTLEEALQRVANGIGSGDAVMAGEHEST